ncbi:hypothetical protein RUND412_005669 [Rhizina undulata]
MMRHVEAINFTVYRKNIETALKFPLHPEQDKILQYVSLCYQALHLEYPSLRNSVTLVLSPLKLLHTDQVENCTKLNIKACAVNADTLVQDRTLLERIHQGEFRIVYFGPEQVLKNEPFQRLLHSSEFQNKIFLTAIDEAHTILDWGFTFRPIYLLIGELRTILHEVLMILLSATLTDTARQEVCKRLFIKFENVRYWKIKLDRVSILPEV